MNTDIILPIVLDLLVKSTGVLLLAFAVQSLWRRASAAQRCLVWGTTFAVLALLPLTLLVTPRWSFALKKAPALPPPVVSVAAPMEETTVAPFEEFTTNEPVPVAWSLPQVNALEGALGCWMAVAACVLGWRVMGAWQVRRLRKKSATLGDARVKQLITRLAREVGVRRRIRAHASAHITVPLTWGALRPVLMLPEQAATWKTELLAAALRHELGHIRHWDALTRLLGTLVCAFHWPNFLVWLAAKSWRTAQEQACDDLVLRAGASTQDYAMQLLDAARGLNAGVSRHAPVMAMARPSTLESRLTAIMDDTRDRRPVGGGAWFASSSALAAALLACAALQLRAEEKTPPTDVKRNGAEQEGLKLDVAVRGDLQATAKEAENAQQKAERIIIPQITFNQASLEESVEFLGIKAKQHDPDKKGINIMIAGTPPGQPQITLDLKEAPLSEALKYVAELAGMKLRYDDAAVVIVAKDDAQTKGVLITRSFRIPDALVNTLTVPIESLPVEGARRWLEGQGVVFGEGSSGLFSKDKPVLIVRNTPAEMAKVEAIVEKFASPPAKTSGAAADPASEAAGDLFLVAFQLWKDGETLERKGNKEGAIQKYLGAQKQIKDVARLYPKWQADVVAYRLDVVEQNLFRLGHAVTRSAATGAGGQARPYLPGQVRPPESAALARARKIIIPHVQFSGATVTEAVKFLEIKSREFDKEEKDISKKGVDIDLQRGAANSTAMITLDLKDVSLAEAVRYVAELANMTFHAGPAFLIIEGSQELTAATPATKTRIQVKEVVTANPAVGKGKATMEIGPHLWLKADSITADPSTQEIVATGGVRLIAMSMITDAEKIIVKTDGQFHAVGPAKTSINRPLSLAERLVVPTVEFRDATVEEVLEFLRTKATALDPKKEGVNILLKPGRTSPKITLSLKQVSLHDALAAVAQLAGLGIKFDSDAIILEYLGERRLVR